MRILFKTSYLDDIRLFRHGGNVFWYGLLVACLLVAPARAARVLRRRALAGVHPGDRRRRPDAADRLHGAREPRPRRLHGASAPTSTPTSSPRACRSWSSFPVAGLAALAAGIAVALPANRMTGIYLAIATLAFSQIVEQVVVRWESVTRGFQGMPVPPPDLFGHRLAQRLGVLLSVPGRARGGGARRHQPDALADGPGHGGDPRLRDLRAEPRRQPGALQDHRLRHQRLHHRARRRAVRPQAASSSRPTPSTSSCRSSCC